MPRKIADITIDEGGKTIIDMVGGDGPSCLKDLRKLAAMLGPSGKEIKKREYYKSNTQQNKVKQERG